MDTFCFSEFLKTRPSSGFKKTELAPLEAVFPFLPGAIMQLKNQVINDVLRCLKGKQAVADLRPSTRTWLLATLGEDAQLEEFLRHGDFVADNVDDIECLHTLRNWCSALLVDCHLDLAGSRQAIRDSDQQVLLDEDFLDATGTPVKMAIANLIGVEFRESEPRTLFEGLCDKSISRETLAQANVPAPAAPLAAAVADATSFTKDELRSMSQGDRDTLGLCVGAPSATKNRVALFDELLQKSRADSLLSIDSVVEYSNSYWKHAKETGTLQCKLAPYSPAHILRGWLVALTDGSSVGARIYWYQIVRLVVDEPTTTVTLSNLSDGSHLCLPKEAVIDSESVKKLWIYSPASPSLTDPLLTSFVNQPTLPVTYPTTACPLKRVSAYEEAPLLAAGRQRLTTNERSQSLLPPPWPSTTAEDTFSVSRGATISETNAFMLGQPGRTLLGEGRASRMTSNGKFSTGDTVTMTQMSLSDSLLELPITSDQKQLENLYQMNVTTEPSASSFHIQQFTKDRQTITKTADLKEAVEFFATFWDLAIDPSGKTNFMRSALYEWISLLAPSSPHSLSKLPAKLLVKAFMKCLLQMAGVLRDPTTASLPRHKLLDACTTCMVVEPTALLTQAAILSYGSNSSQSTSAAAAKRQSPATAGKSSRAKRQAGSSSNFQRNNRSRNFSTSSSSSSSASVSAESPCYSHMLNTWGGNPRKCDRGNCGRIHNLQSFSKASLTGHANHLTGVYGEAVKAHIANMST